MSHLSRHMRAVAMLGVVAVLALVGVAGAQSGEPGQGGPRQGTKPAGPPPGGGGPGMIPKGLTYAQFHVLKENGESEVIRLDQGKITAIDGSSVTLEENDGSSVTVALDADTEVLAGPGKKGAGVEDLSVGQQASVSAPQGGTARSIMVAPKKPPMKG